MNLKNKTQLYRNTIKKWGVRSQLEMLQEESTELALACRKFIRQSTKERFKGLGSEIADVEIMIEQIKQMYPSIISIIESEKEYKLNRLLMRINENKFE